MTAKDTTAARILQLRVAIDQIDDGLVALLVQRYRIGRKIGRTKHEAGLPLADPGRESAVLDRVAAEAERLGGPAAACAVRKVFQRIVRTTRDMQQVTASSGKGGKNERDHAEGCQARPAS